MNGEFDETTVPDIDNKLILMDIAAELQQIRKLLEGETPGQEEKNNPIVQCGSCGTKIPKEEREEHARKCFNWHNDMGMHVLDSVYERINHGQN